MTSQNFSSKFKLLLVAGVVALGGLGFLVASSFGGDSTAPATADTAAATQQSANQGSASTTQKSASQGSNSTTNQSAQGKAALGAYFGGASGKNGTPVGADNASFSVNAYGPVWHISKPTEEDYLNLDSPEKAKARKAFAKLSKLYTDEYNLWEQHTQENYVKYFFPVNEEGYQQAYKSVSEIFLPLAQADGWTYSNSTKNDALERVITELMPAVHPFLVADAPHLAQYIATHSLVKLSVSDLTEDAADNPRTETAYLEPIDLPNALGKANNYLRQYQDYVGDVTPEQANKFLWYFANADIVKQYTKDFPSLVRKRTSRYLMASENDTTVPSLRETLAKQIQDGKIENSAANKLWSSIVYFADQLVTPLFYERPGAYEIGEYMGALTFVPPFPAQCQSEDYACVENALKDQVLKAKQLRNYLAAGSYLKLLKENAVFNTKDDRFVRSDRIRQLLARYYYTQAQ